MSNQFFLPESLCEIDAQMDLEKISTIYENHSTIIGKIIRIDFYNQLFIVDLGGNIMATMPFKDSTIYPIYDSKNTFSLNIITLFRKIIQAKISSIDNNNIILSRKENMLEAIEVFKKETEPIFAIITGFSKLSAFIDIGAGIIGRCYTKNFSNIFFNDIRDIGINIGDMISAKIIDFLEDENKFELSRTDTLPNPSDILNRGDVVNCTIFSPLDDGIGYYALIDTIFCGIVDSPVAKLQYGDKVEALVKNFSQKGPRLNFIRKSKKIPG